MYELCINTGLGFGSTVSEILPKIKEAGFDGFFTGWHEGKTKEIAELADKYGLLYQSVHAPFHDVAEMWEPGDKGEYVKEQLINCVNECKDAGIPRIVMHAVIGMDKHTPTDIGLQRFCRVVKRAEKIGINVAFENLEGPEYLAIVMDQFRSSYVGFCWDTGHERCYNHCQDMTALYGDRLMCTHLNDNFGMTDENTLTWLDDSHMMPFDGKNDWQNIADRLKAHNYKGELTFELTCKSKPGRTTHDIYASLDELGFLTLAHEKAVKFRELL